MKRLSRVLFMLSLCATLTGCWDRHEVKDLALVMATGIDKSDQGTIRVTSQVAVPSSVAGGQTGGGNAQQKSFVIESAEGIDIMDAVQKLQERIPRRLYPSHQQVFVIGEKQARDGLQDVFDTFSRDPRNRLRTFVLVAKGDTAENVLKAETELEQIPGQEIGKLEKSDFGTKTTTLDFINEMATEGIVPVVGGIERRTTGDQKFWLSSTAVFKHGRLVGYLNDEETRGLLWVKGKIHHAYVTTDVPGGGAVTMYVTSASRQIRHTVHGNTIRFNINLTGRGEIVENTSNLDLNQEQSLSIVNQRLNNSVRDYVMRSIGTAQQELKADAFGLGEEIYRNDTTLWRRIGGSWDDIFPTVQVTVHVYLETLRPGTTSSTAQFIDSGTQSTGSSVQSTDSKAQPTDSSGEFKGKSAEFTGSGGQTS